MSGGSGLRGLFRSLSAVYVANLVNGVLGVIFVPVALRRLGPAGYGLYGIYAVLAGYVVLAELGLGKNLLRSLAGQRDPRARAEELRAAFGVYLALSAILIAALPLLVYAVPRYVFPMPPAHHAAVAWIAVLAVVEYVVGVPASMMQTRCVADEDFTRYSRYSLASGLLRYSLSFLGVALFARPELVVAVIVSRRVGDIALARAIMGPLPPGSWSPRFSPRQFGAVVARSSQLSVAQLLQLTVVSLGAMLVNWSLGLRALGVYRAVFDLASKVWFFSNAIGLVIFPRFVRLLASPESRERLRLLLPRVLVASWVGYATLAVGAAAVGPWVLGHIGMGGSEFTALFVLVAAGICFNAHAGLPYEFMQATGAYRRVVVLAGTSLAGMVAIFFAVRHVAPALAIGWAWLGSQVLYSLVSDLAAADALEVPLRAQVAGLRDRAAAAVGVALAALAALSAPGARGALAAGLLVAIGGALAAVFLLRARALQPLARST